MTVTIPLPWTNPPLTGNRDRGITFVVPGEPASKARPRFTGRGSKTRAFTPEATRQAEAQVAAAYLKVAKRVNEADSRTAYEVTAEFHLTRHQRRDVDNMLKLILDGLNKIAWADDNQVTSLMGAKFFGAVEGRTVVTVTPVGEMPSSEATCEHCGKSYPRPPSHARKKFCSGVCRSAALAAKRTRACGYCEGRFLATKASQRYCSPDCGYKAKHLIVTCAACGTEFTKAKSLNRSGNAYCSPECKATYWREHRKSAAKGTCSDCGGPTSKKSYLRCRDCSFAAGGRHAPPPTNRDAP